MILFDYLYNTYGTNEPIFISDIKFKNYSKPWIDKEIASLCSSGKIIRFERGIYYIPTDTIFGKTLLDPNKVIEKKYIFKNREIIGFYSGLTALNNLGLTTQVPNVIEICTNNEATKVRDIKIGGQKIIIRKSKIKITNDNFNTIQLLDIMNYVPNNFFDKERKSIIKKWVKKKNITRESVLEYVSEFPNKTSRNIIESEAIFYLT